MKLMMIIASMMLSLNVFAMDFTTVETANQLQVMAKTTGLNWVAGDNTVHNINMGFIPGTNNTTVRSVDGSMAWLVSDIDLMIQKQKAEILIDLSTGEIKKLIVNGEEQDPPQAGNMEIISAEEAKITVPAGTFDAIHLKIKDVDKNEVSQTWINMDEIPINGAAKMIQPSQMGEVK
ncbi:MAG: hypothetical protein AB8E15_03215, partial [Bdellovibrionales bacterium]